MYKEITLLTKSRKKDNYCIAGIETETGNWIRIISEDAKMQYAVSPNDMQYEDGSMPEILNIIKIKCKRYNPSIHQPENFVLDDTAYWEKIGEASIKELLELHPCENKSFLFYDTDKRIDAALIHTINEKDKYSLILIAPKDVCIHVKEWDNDKQVTLSFNYSGNRYWYIRITDTKFENMYLKYPEGNYSFMEDCLLVISLADVHKDGKHYKLIAQVLYK